MFPPVLALVNTAQSCAEYVTLTDREANDLIDRSVRYAAARSQLVSGNASSLPPLQKGLLRRELEEEIADLRNKADGTSNVGPTATPSPSSTPLPQPGPSIPVITPVPYPKNGKVAYVFYTSNPGAEFSKQASYQKTLLTKQGYKVNLVCTNDVTAFSDAWNHMDPKTGAAVIISHSNGMSLLFEEGTRSNAISANGTTIDKRRSLPLISDLNGPEVSLLYILACNAAHQELLNQEGTNIAQAFADLPNVDTVYAYDGSVGFGIPDFNPDLAPRLAYDQSGYFAVYDNFDIPYKFGIPSGIQKYGGDEE